MIVLDSIQLVVDAARHVSLDDSAIARWAASITADDLRPVHHTLPALLPGNRAQLANLTLLIDSLNFCFWSDDPPRNTWNGTTYHRFDAMFVAILKAAQADPRWFDARHWAWAEPAEIAGLLACDGQLPMLAERERILRETGRTLMERFDGQFADAVDSVNRDAWALAVLLMTNFDSFRDVACYADQPIFIMKRAQICALDLSVAWDTHGHGPLDNLDALTAFADYRVPQGLRQLGILQLTPDLATRIQNREWIHAGSPEEVEIRAATVLAVERMRQALAGRGRPTPAWQIDWYLWALARGPGVTVEHHRTWTTFY